MLLSVLSALARLNIDPWDEAARLARLPCEVATHILTKLIVALPNGLPEGLDAVALARQLIALLPRQGASRAPSARPAAVGGFAIDRNAVTTCLLLYLVLTVIFLGAQWLIAPPQEPARPGATASPMVGPASSPAQTSRPAGDSPQH